MRVPLTNVTVPNLFPSKLILKVIDRVISSGKYILGPELSLFESEFSSFIGTKYCLGVANGTEALTLAVKALGLGSKDEVIISTNSYPTFFGVANAGVRVRLYDIGLESINRAISPHSKAVIVTHLYGQPEDLGEIIKICRKYKLYLIEDCAQAHGAKYKRKVVGSVGEIGCFSFYPTKNLGAIGDGGAIVTSNKSLALAVKALRMYGETSRYHSQYLGMNSRLDELQAAILRVKLKNLPTENAARQQAAQYYLSRLKYIMQVNLPQILLHTTPVFHLFVIRARHRNHLQKYLFKNGIITGIHFPTPVHLQKSAAFLGYKKGDFPESEKISSEILSLPIFPSITKVQQDYVIEHITRFYHG